MPDYTLVQAMGLLISSFIVYEFTYIAYQSLFSPLRNIPGPRLAAVSSIWSLYHGLVRRQKFIEIDRCHKKYGPVIRIAPDTVAVNDVAGLKSVYQSKLDKVPAYNAFRTNNGTPNSFCAIQQNESTGKRRGMLAQYSTSNLAVWHPIMTEHAQEAVDLINCRAGQPLNVCSMIEHFLVDILGNIVLNSDINALRDFGNGQSNSITVSIRSWPKRGQVKGRVPPLVWKLLEYIPGQEWQKIVVSDARLGDFVRPRVQETRSKLDLESPPEYPCLSERLSVVINSYTGQFWPESHVISECIDHFLGGTETTSTSVSYTLYTLGCRPDVMKSLQAEIDNIMPDPQQFASISTLAGLPYLNAVIKESLRLYPPSPGTLDRIVPAGGLTFQGHYLPPGTAVGVQTWSLHRDDSVFPEPTVYKPERWLNEGDPEEQEAMMRSFTPFSVGGRSCPGVNLAYVDLRLIISTLVRNFDIEVPPYTNDETMSPRDLTTITPKAGRCELIFHPRVKA